MKIVVEGGTVAAVEGRRHAWIERVDYCVLDRDLLTVGELRTECYYCANQCDEVREFLVSQGNEN